MMTNEQLAEAVARVKELDAKRTQGVITTDRDKQRPMITTPYDGHHCLTPDDVAYYNHAPQMAAVIAQLWDERERWMDTLHEDKALETIQQHRDVMRMAREALLYVESNYDGMNKAAIPTQAIAALDAALKGGE